MTSVGGEVNAATPSSVNPAINSENGGKDFGNFGDHFLLQPEIKQEESLDIDDVEPVENIKRMPVIRLTPTTKLLATPNPTDPKRKFVCPYDDCDKSYGKSSHLRSHLTWHTGVKPFVCQEPSCGKGFTRSDELNRHVRTHTGEKPFECIQCTKKFSRSDHLTKHLATHAKQLGTPKRGANKINNVNTNSTNESRVRKPNVKKMLLETNDLKMSATAITMIPRDSLNHVRDIASSVPVKDLLQANIEKAEQKSPSFTHEPIKIKLERPENSSDYQIVPTSIMTSSTKLLSMNNPSSDRKNNELIVGDDEIMPEANAPPLLPSDVCIKTEPMESEAERPFHCEHCFRTFRRETDLNRHRHVHSEGSNILSAAQVLPQANGGLGSNFDSHLSYNPERPFRCKDCPKSFRRQDDLYRHMRTHTGEKPFACNECDRRFLRSDHLQKHMKTHTRLR